MEYTVIENSDLNKLVLHVNDNISKGWKPLGGVSCSIYEDCDVYWYCQAIIREKEFNSWDDLE